MRILILRPGAIGDTLLTLPILQYLHRAYHDPHITFVGNAHVLPLIQAFGLADTVSDYEETQWGHFLLPLSSDRDDRTARLQAVTQDTDMAIFWLRDPDNVLRVNAEILGIKHVFIAPGRPGPDEHEHITRYLLRTLGEQGPQGALWSIPAAYAWQREPVSPGQPRALAIHPGSGGARKCWPIEYFAELIQQLWQRQVPIQILGGPADHERLVTLRSHLPPAPSPSMLRMLVDVPLLQLAQQLQQSRGYIGNDAGITHLAALLGIPTLALFGPSDPIVWHPLGPAVTIIYEPRLEHLSVTRVLSYMQAWLN